MPDIKIALILIVVILLIKYLRLKKEIRHLSRQMVDLLDGRSEKMMDISLIDRDLERLAGILNQYNQHQRQAIAKVVRHEKYLKESVANISHDLRTPLTVILGHLQLLNKETFTEEQSKRIKIVFNKAERMKALIKSFYDLSVLDAGQMMPQREQFNLTNLIMNLIVENAPAMEYKGITPELDMPDHSVYLDSDYNMIERIFQNLLNNAIRYASGKIKIHLTQRADDRVVFRIENPIQDTAEINVERIFERFYTGDQSRHNSGTGVGLAVVKLLTEQLDGKVTAELESGSLSITLEL